MKNMGSANVAGERRRRTSKMWIGSASKNSCATIIVNSSSARTTQSSAKALEKKLQWLTSWDFVHATPPLRLDRTKACTRKLLALLLAHRIRRLDEVNRSHWRRRAFWEGFKGLLERVRRLLKAGSKARTRSTSARSVPRPGPSSTILTLEGAPWAAHCVTNQIAKSWEDQWVSIRRGGGWKAHLAKDLRDLRAGDKVSSGAKDLLGGVIAESRMRKA